ncbi:MAG: pyridoxal-phosphate dependent enzyme [Verrucomicrobiota bacterium]
MTLLTLSRTVGQMATSGELTQLLHAGINRARTRVYQVAPPTPLQTMVVDGREVWVKREDLGPIKAYKWRGAFNAVAALSPEERAKGIVAASAGNHAQGIAIAANRLGCEASIFMPKPTPEVKRASVLSYGGDRIEIHLVGDSYSETQEAAMAYAEERGGVFIPPYDSIDVMAGQGTLADEIVMHADGPFDRVYVAVGGGGIAAAVSTWIKSFWPDCKVIGVEGVGQASMKAAFEAGKPVPLDYVDIFCDGTAVAQVGDLTYPICRENLDEIVTVTNDEVSEAIKMHWDTIRVIPEPSGALSLAGLEKQSREGKIGSDEKCVTILCGANMDFAQLAQISRQAGLAARRDHSWRFAIPEKPGALVDLLESLPTGVSIYDLQYGRTETEKQYPVLRLVAPEGEQAAFETWLRDNRPLTENVSDSPEARYRVIPFSPALFTAPWFIEVEFPERAGALREFMREVRGHASLCYFNYTYSGERVGRALLGLDFDSEEARTKGISSLRSLEGKSLRSLREVSGV